MFIPSANSHKPVRVCDACYNQSSSSLLHDSDSESTVNEPQWHLNVNEQDNDSIREEFYFDAAPSGSLCLRILRFHSNPTRCLNVILEHLCEPLFELLASIDIDFGLLIGVIKSLLTAAQAMIHERRLGNDDMLTRINFLLDRLDIVKMLVDDHCIDPELIKMAIHSDTNDNSLQNLQDRLIDLERFELALRVAAKLNENSKRIWKLWAFLCIKNSRFGEARAKFRYCFKRKSDVDSTEHNSALLSEIFETFKGHKLRSSGLKLRDRCRLIREGKANTLNQATGDCDDLPDILQQEANYYLQTYGTSEDQLRFFAQFKMYTSAIELLCREQPSTSITSIFIKEIIHPALIKGHLDKVLKQITNVDSTLENMHKHLINVCKYLTHQRLFSILHQIQLFMCDYVRAAMTKVNHFYLQPPPSDYIQLYHRLENLNQAKKHCLAYLDQNQKLTKGCLNWSADEVSRLIRTLDLQIELTKRFYESDVSGVLPFDSELKTDSNSDQSNCSLASESFLSKSICDFGAEFEINQWILDNDYDKIDVNEIESKELQRKRVPLTLLSSVRSDRIELVALVIFTAGNSTSEGFAFACKVIQEYDLDVAEVFRVAVKILIHSKKVNFEKILTELLDCMKNCKSLTSVSSAELNDELVGMCISQTNNTASCESLIKLLQLDLNKIESYMMIGKLKQAYLIAVKLNNVDLVLRIRTAAFDSKQEAILRICDMWLSKRINSNA